MPCLCVPVQKPMSGRKEKTKVPAEESSSGGSSSPSPGDTLPWNLSKHQRTKRSKSASGNGTVLDAAERAVLRIAGSLNHVYSVHVLYSKWQRDWSD
ncbi:microtubule-actin cross-linking factor 1-like [Polyodon spathula]|uniref:microtubule-actin cross-linking factor 1-like n=1 Tax=Polyodon spathula TaxID=7913 RepID=UPI001B7F517B|nr:microtubule-actin cross-linking factor 1-like [Polyodon spathula]